MSTKRYAAAQSTTLDVQGVVLHYQVQGTGPVLLLSQSGEGDADRTVDLVPHLADAFTVVTYDRRGLSRSRLDEPQRTATLVEHADDVRHILAAVTDEPALMLGCSFGAVVGLHAALRHPGLIGTLIAHEPVAPRLLPEAERLAHERELAGLVKLYETEGLRAVLPEIARAVGIDPSGADAEPGLTPQPLDADRLANFDRFIRHDFAAILDDTLDPGRIASLGPAGTRVVPAAGLTTPRTVFDYRCAEALAELTGSECRFLPGGHNGNTSHPRAYAARLRQILGAEVEAGTGTGTGTQGEGGAEAAA
ncbi:alpha/beta fold hydrolase [Streptomyces sp. NPDC048018]|uniref:alpha/beta fold hydrolase n=1 Tax=Streptomyces sp. NPDC048018 TaxID=3365499 RepID=UPI0037143029